MSQHTPKAAMLALVNMEAIVDAACPGTPTKYTMYAETDRREVHLEPSAAWTLALRLVDRMTPELRKSAVKRCIMNYGDASLMHVRALLLACDDPVESPALLMACEKGAVQVARLLLVAGYPTVVQYCANAWAPTNSALATAIERLVREIDDFRESGDGKNVCAMFGLINMLISDAAQKAASDALRTSVWRAVRYLSEHDLDAAAHILRHVLLVMWPTGGAHELRRPGELRRPDELRRPGELRRPDERSDVKEIPENDDTLIAAFRRSQALFIYDAHAVQYLVQFLSMQSTSQPACTVRP